MNLSHRSTWCLLLLPLSCVFLVGCGASSRSVDALHPPDSSEPVFVDVFIFRGNVLIVEDPGIDEVLIERRFGARDQLVRVDRNVDIYGDLNQSLDLIEYHASMGRGPRGQLVCTINAQTAHHLPDEQRVDLHVRLPRISGVNVQTRDGWIDLRNVSGPIRASTENADIIVATAHSLDQSVDLVTSSGHVDLRMPAASAGAIDIEAAGGYAVVDPGSDQMQIQRSGNERVFGRLNSGHARMTLRTVNGNARVILRDDPMRVTPIERAAVPIGRPGG